MSSSANALPPKNQLQSKRSNEQEPSVVAKNHLGSMSSKVVGLPQNISESLIYEILDGMPIYRKGYQKVLSKEKDIDDIKGVNGLRAVTTTIVTMWLKTVFPKKEYWVLHNKLGLFLSKQNTLTLDIAVFNKKVLTIDQFTHQYLQICPALVVEVGVSITSQNINYYIFNKTQKLLDFGCERVIWVYPEVGKVMLAIKGEDWIIKDWGKEIAFTADHHASILQLLKDKGLEF